MEYRFNVEFSGSQSYIIDAENEDEAYDKLAQEVEWDVPNLLYYEPTLLDRPEEEEEPNG